jgi:hypothetical protein
MLEIHPIGYERHFLVLAQSVKSKHYLMEEKLKPVFNKRIFWDVVFENIDYDAKANFVIERVF